MGMVFDKSVKLAAATALAALISAGAASATTMTLRYDNPAVGSGFERVDVKTPEKNNVNAGAFNMKDQDTLESFTVFCLDLLANIYPKRDYGYKTTETPFSNSVDLMTIDGSGYTGVDRIQRIFDAGYSTALVNKVSSAGFQVALWNAVYDTDWSVSQGAGEFYQVGTENEDVRSAANTFLSAAMDYRGGKKWNLTFLESTATDPRSQNLVTMAPVPLPAAGFMLLTALGGLFAARRRKSS